MTDSATIGSRVMQRKMMQWWGRSKFICLEATEFIAQSVRFSEFGSQYSKSKEMNHFHVQNNFYTKLLQSFKQNIFRNILTRAWKVL